MLPRFNERLIGPEAAALFDLAAGFLFVESTQLGASGGFGGAALLGRVQHGQDHVPQFVVAGLDVLRLIAELLAVDDDLAVGCDATGIRRFESFAQVGS